MCGSVSCHPIGIRPIFAFPVALPQLAYLLGQPELVRFEIEAAFEGSNGDRTPLWVGIHESAWLSVSAQKSHHDGLHGQKGPWAALPNKSVPYREESWVDGDH